MSISSGMDPKTNLKLAREIAKLSKSGTESEKLFSLAISILNDELRAHTVQIATLEKKVATLEKKLR